MISRQTKTNLQSGFPGSPCTLLKSENLYEFMASSLLYPHKIPLTKSVTSFLGLVTTPVKLRISACQTKKPSIGCGGERIRELISTF
jgi:hypothetical protein